MYKISSKVLDPQKLEHDFSFCGVIDLEPVELCAVKYLLAGRGCNFDKPTEVTWDNVKSYVAPNGGEIIYVTDVSN
mgnify:CR=1 FL=1